MHINGVLYRHRHVEYSPTDKKSFPRRIHNRLVEADNAHPETSSTLGYNHFRTAGGASSAKAHTFELFTTNGAVAQRAAFFCRCMRDVSSDWRYHCAQPSGMESHFRGPSSVLLHLWARFRKFKNKVSSWKRSWSSGTMGMCGARGTLVTTRNMFGGMPCMSFALLYGGRKMYF